MSKCQTVEICCDEDHKFVVINKEDFDKEIHKIYKAAKKSDKKSEKKDDK